ncbi:serine hydrolase-like protein isoform X2 [Plodia interpunctella]|uniref:serine hydrolase-like protein isoform X2 n=1 Tax=Plodia interpunctella TaxID=58824 RepID=UPI002367F722|nr:serine hydrolase-like protein isoform X2 [Plodia interpunctella]
MGKRCNWGDRHRPGVLLVHGYMDSAATFEALVSLLPDTYHYVSFDFPGHGKSDHVLSNLLVPQGLVVEIIKEIVKHLQWRSFVCIAHSMGCAIVTLYQHLYPGRITKMIHIDPLVALTVYYYFNEIHGFWFQWYYEYYYDHYFLYNSAPPRLYTREQLIESTMVTRHLTREQAEIVLSRSLVPVENGLFRVSTQPIMRRMINLPAFKDAFSRILQHNIPPTLCIHATKSEIPKAEREFVDKFFRTDKKRLNVYFDAHHDLHITHASDLVPTILNFLNRKSVEAKL